MAKKSIYINPDHKGQFHRDVHRAQNQHITEADIAEGLRSKDPAVRMRANFARNSRKWEHKGRK